MNSRIVVGLALSCFWVAQLVHPGDLAAGTVTLHPVADTSIYSAFPNNNFGGGTTFTAGGRPQGGESRGLLLFNLQGSVPAGAIIQSVSLQLTVENTPNRAANSIFDLNALTASWGEGTGADRGGSPAGPNAATWLNRLGTSGAPWINPGGDFSSALSAFATVLGNGSYTFASTPQLVSDVQGWLDNPAGDFGWILRSESEQVARTIRRFYSRADPFNSPALTIQFAVPEPGVGSLLILALGTMICRRRFQ
jgi:hypothetical protein